MTKAASETTNTPSIRPTWSGGVKAAVSVLIAIHLLAVFSAPWGSPPPASELAEEVGRRFHPYTQTLAIDNGYRYFAPDPLPSFIVRYTLKNADGSETNGEFPDRTTQRPRLHYHRHLILADTMSKWVAAAPNLPADIVLTPAEREEYEHRRERTQTLLRSVADHLLAVNPDAQSVEMVLHEHAIPAPKDILNGVELTDESLYKTSINIGVFGREQP